MTLDGEDRWICGRKVCAVNLHCVSSIVRDIREPCLYHSPTKGTKMLKPDKWQAIFDADGRVLGFKKALKMIILGGVDPSIRAEVWEFLLGCYPLGTTTEYRRQLRMARRERYTHLIRQCQNMHSSIGTGTLAYVVGSKVMDMRPMSKDNESWEKDTKSGKNLQDAINEIDSYGELRNDSTNTSNACQRASFSDSGDLVSARESTDGAAYECFSSKPNSYFDFPPLPVTNLFHNSDNLGDEVSHRQSAERSLKSGAEAMHSFQINNNVDLIMESVGSSSSDALHASNGDSEMPSSNLVIPVSESTNLGYETEVVDILRKTNVVNVPEVAMDNDSTSIGVTFGEARISEWLWTLHNIVVDVVRTDSHLEFYNNSKNMARMSDILAVYAWVDPATGYCQGMSDLLSPFVILYEDDADAFWCFEMLLRRMRENFQMEGPTGVMKQLQALWKILELTDNEMFTHLSLIGAESLHFAFRMLLVLFRRELSFNEALCMWEMIWAADFNESAVQEIEVNCLEPLIVQLPRDSTVAETIVELVESRKRNSKAAQSGNSSLEHSGSFNNGVRSVSSYPFCGLASASFWARTDRMPIDTVTTATKNGDDDLPAFCVAAVLILNRQKVIRATHSLDDLIKMFNDKMPKINVRRCIRMAIKLRKKYVYKLMKVATMGNSEQLTDGGV